MNNNALENYWLSHSVGRMDTEGYKSACLKYANAWEQPEPWPIWMGLQADFINSVTRLINAAPANICPQLNVSAGLCKLLESLSKGKKRLRILLSEQDFSTISYVAKALPSAELIYLQADAEHTDLDTWTSVIDENIDVAIITHVFSNTGQRSPVAKIVEHCTAHGVVSVVDVAQSVGVIPIDIASWQPDALLGTSVKWLCGGSGAAFMYVSEALCSKLEPSDVGWFSHENPFEFDPHEFRYAPDARRFLGGTPSILPYAIAAESIGRLINHGIDKVYLHNQYTMAKVVGAVDSDWLVSPKSADLRGGTVVIKAPELQQVELEQRLVSAGVHFDVRSTGIRLSGHLNIDDVQLDYLVGLLRKVG